MRTPYFLIKQDELQKNIDEFRKALADVWPNSQIAYSVKTNSLPWVLQYMGKNNIYAEVVSDEEYELARLNGFMTDKIIFNGPIKGHTCFSIAVSGGSIVNLDSQRELEWLADVGSSSNIGIRVNVDPDIFENGDVEYENDGFRFGYSDETGAFEKALNAVRKTGAHLGLHLHCNSITRSPNVYRAIAKYAATLIKKYSLKLSFIDFGGGFFGGVPGKATAKEYIYVIKNNLGDAVDFTQTRLIIEPGSALICSAIDLYTSVVDVKDTCRTRIVTTDGSRVHIDPLWIKSHYMYEIIGNGKMYPGTQIVCGYTCMDHDRIMKLNGEKALAIGDQIIYKRVGAYSVTFGGMFIRYLPDVYVQGKTGIVKARSAITVETYNSLEG